MNDGYEHAGLWIERYEHGFPNAATGKEREITVWRVLTRKGGVILSKHLPSEGAAKKAADDWAQHRPGE